MGDVVSDELISETSEGPVETKLTEMTSEQLLKLAIAGSDEAINLLRDRAYGHQQ